MILKKLPSVLCALFCSWCLSLAAYAAAGEWIPELESGSVAREARYMSKCEELFKQGTRAEAVRLANQAFFEFDAPDDQQWREFFQKHSIPIPTAQDDPRAAAYVTKQVKNLCKMPEPHNNIDLKNLFGRKFEIISRSKLGPSWASEEETTSPILKISMGPTEVNHGTRILLLKCNRALQTLSIDEFDYSLRGIGKPEKGWSDQMATLGALPPADVLTMKLPDSVLTLNFSRDGKQLNRAYREWKLHTTEPFSSNDGKESNHANLHKPNSPQSIP